MGGWVGTDAPNMFLLKGVALSLALALSLSLSSMTKWNASSD